MDQRPDAPPAYYAPAPIPHVVHIRAKPGGLWSSLGFILGIMIFAGAFFVGIMFGVFGMIAASSTEAMLVEQNYRSGSREKIVILPVEGVIDARQSEFVRAAVDSILNDKRVRAVVLRVDSPGGGVTASDQIWYEVERLKQNNLPVIASYGGIAASGGYYVSCAADVIIAEETCITGSIGVIAQIFTLHGLMDKIGIEPVTLVASGSPEKAVANDLFREWNENDQQKILTMIDKAYDIFNRRVRDGRSKVITDPTQINRLANGSIYTAQQALDGGLIDGIGYLDDAIVRAEQLARLTPGRSQVVRIAAPPSLMSVLAGRERSAWRSPLDADVLRGMVNDLGTPRLMYLMR